MDVPCVLYLRGTEENEGRTQGTEWNPLYHTEVPELLMSVTQRRQLIRRTKQMTLSVVFLRVKQWTVERTNLLDLGFERRLWGRGPTEEKSYRTETTDCLGRIWTSKGRVPSGPKIFTGDEIFRQSIILCRHNTTFLCRIPFFVARTSVRKLVVININKWITCRCTVK